jgi:acyl transferase domain-containing protein/NADP-dependent 3-hydroxy acid dehydrogenase YdfG
MKLEPIAVTGVSALFPGSTDAAGFWRDILAGTDLIREVPETHWRIADYYDADPQAPDRIYSKRGAFLPPIPFNPLAYGIPPNVLPATDCAQILALIVAERALKDATGGRFPNVDRERMSVILGVTGTTALTSHMAGRLERPRWEAALREYGLDESEVAAICDRISSKFTPWQENTFPGFLGNVIAGRIANRLDLRGTNCIVDAACASSLAAVSMAFYELQAGGSDLVLVGGVDTLNVPLMYMAFARTGALSKADECRPFADGADGTALGEGIGMLALRRLADAERDQDRIYAVIKGLGTSSDGRSKSIYAPVCEGQARALQRAYETAAVSPATVELIEAHGTGTVAGDATEFRGLEMAFAGAGRADKQWCALGSVKSQIGHTKGAAGLAGLFKAIMALHHKVLPPTIKVEKPNPAFKIEESPFYLNTQARPWARAGAHPRRAGVSSFGFGGTNFHVVCEEYQGGAPRAFRLRTAPSELVVWSAAGAAPLVEKLGEALAGIDEARGPSELQRLARGSQEQFDAGLAARCAIVATDLKDLRVKLQRALAAAREHPHHPLEDPTGIFYGIGAKPGRIAFLFPGQGSQYPWMMQDLTIGFDVVREPLDVAAGLFSGNDMLHDVVFPRRAFTDAETRAQAERLTRTEWAQPAIGASSAGLLGLLRKLGIEAACVAGHSFGELTALHAAGAIDLPALLGAARKRGELMAAAGAAPGAMTAVLGPSDRASAVLSERHAHVVIANHNSPWQVVISGPVESVTAAERDLVAAGLSCRRLAVSAAFHSSLVSGASVPFRAFLDTLPIRSPALPVLANVTASPYPADPAAMRDLLAEQITSSVRFADTITAMAADGVRTFIEVGPGNVLTGLVAECLQGEPHLTVALDRKGQSGWTSLWQALGRLAVAGLPIRWEAIWNDYAPVTPPELEPSRSIVMVGGANPNQVLPPPAPPATAPAAARVAQPVVGIQTPQLTPAVPPSTEPERRRIVDRSESPMTSARPPAPPAPRANPTTPAPIAASAPGQGLGPTKSPAPDRWSSTLRHIMHDTAKVQREFQRTLAESHRVYLQSVEQTIRQLTAFAGTAPTQAPACPPQVQMPEAQVSPLAIAAPQHEAAFQVQQLPIQEEPVVHGRPRSVSGNGDSRCVPAAPVLPNERQLEDASPSAEPTLARDVPNAAGTEIVALVIEVVAEKTGYPPELLTSDMEIEAGLGIDSIKRVEILAALEERLPQIGRIDPALAFTLRTLGDIQNFLGAQNQPLPPAAASDSPRATAEAPAPAGVGRADLQATLVQVVADKTGYPPELLTLDMDVESGLGIDSIKRVEILAALEERLPQCGRFDPSQGFTLRTLGDILRFLEERAGGAAAAATQAPPAVERPAPRPATEAPQAVDRFTLRMVEAPATGFATAGLMDCSPLVLIARNSTRADDLEAEVARLLADALRGVGVSVEVSSTMPAHAHGMVFLGGLRRLASIDEALEVEREAFRAARALARSLPQDGGVFVTLQDTGGDFGLGGADKDQSWLGGLAGLAKTAALEWPGAAVKAIDLERGDRTAAAVAAAIYDELLYGGPEREVALLADGARSTPHLVTAPLPGCGLGKVALDDNAVILVTGGARGVTAPALAGLLERGRFRLALLGRTPSAPEPAHYAGARDETSLQRLILEEARAAGRTLTPLEIRQRVRQVLAQREIAANVAALRAQRGEVRYLVADVIDIAELNAALEVVRAEWGPIRGIVHAAGVLSDKLIRDKTDEQFETVFTTKVHGLRNLLDATRSDPLQAICLFSSVAARWGNRGQCDYAMANEVLNKVAAAEQRRRGAACHVKAIDWGPWEAGMVTPELKTHFVSQGVAMLPVAVGARLLADELGRGAANATEVVVCARAEGGSMQHENGNDYPSSFLPHPAAPPRLEVLINPTANPYLEDHRIADVAVLPAAVVLEWFMRAARLLRPGSEVAACRDLRVLAGARLVDFADGRRFQIICPDAADASATSLRIELHGERGQRHYQAWIDLVRPGDAPRKKGENMAAPLHPSSLPPACQPWPWTADAIYGPCLFHGPAFQVLRALECCGEWGGTAALCGAADCQLSRVWPVRSGSWVTDPAAIDGGLQLALLWALQHTGRKSLPTAFGDFILHVPGPCATPLHCRLTVRDLANHHAVFDLCWVAERGEVVCEMRELTMTLMRQEVPA